MARILIFGGRGKVALLLEPLLVQGGNQVTAVVRNPAHEHEVTVTGATAVVADIETLDTDAIGELVGGHDAVIWSAGAGGGSASRTYSVDRDAAVRSMDAAATAGVNRYVMVSWLGSKPDHGVPPDDSFYPYAQAKLAADEHLRATGMDWTILGPGTLTDGPATGRIALDPQGRGEVSRANVAAVIAAALPAAETFGRTIRFADGPMSIADALRPG